MISNILIWYLAIALVIFSIWFRCFLLDRTTPNNDIMSWIILLIAPFFWPIVLPLSIRELIIKARIKQKHREENRVHQTRIALRAQELKANWREGS